MDHEPIQHIETDEEMTVPVPEVPSPSENPHQIYAEVAARNPSAGAEMADSDQLTHVELPNTAPLPQEDDLARFAIAHDTDYAPDFSQASSADIERELMAGPQPSVAETSADVPANIINRQIISTVQHVDLARSSVMAALGEKVPQFDQPAESPLDSTGRHSLSEDNPNAISATDLIARLKAERDQLAIAQPAAEAVGDVALHGAVESAAPEEPTAPVEAPPLTPHQQAEQLLADLAGEAEQTEPPSTAI